MSNRVYITGIAGFLGSHLAESFVKKGWHVRGCDNLIGGDQENVPTDAVLDVFDCRKLGTLTKIMQEFQPDVVYHTACYPHEGLSVFSPVEITDSVFRSSMCVMTAAINSHTKRVVNMSSMASYGEIPPPFYEHDVRSPRDPYGCAKLFAEQSMFELGKTHGVEVVTAIPHNIVGERQKYDDPYRNVVSIMVNRLLQGKQAIIYGDGKQTRCFSHVDDILPVLVDMGNLERKDIIGQSFNVGPDEFLITILDLFNEISSQLNSDLPAIFFPDRPQEVKHAYCDASKIRKFFGYKTKYTVHDIVMDVIGYVKRKGPKEFNYHLDIEIVSDKTPRTWKEKLI